jgi:hypothetical protein
MSAKTTKLRFETEKNSQLIYSLMGLGMAGGVLHVGETAEVVGKRTAANYWVIKNPDATGVCWLWGMYATVVGNVDLLPEMRSGR